MSRVNGVGVRVDELEALVLTLEGDLSVYAKGHMSRFVLRFRVFDEFEALVPTLEGEFMAYAKGPVLLSILRLRVSGC